MHFRGGDPKDGRYAVAGADAVRRFLIPRQVDVLTPPPDQAVLENRLEIVGGGAVKQLCRRSPSGEPEIHRYRMAVGRSNPSLVRA